MFKHAYLLCDLVSLLCIACVHLCLCACVDPCLFMLRGNAYISCWAKRSRWTNSQWRRVGLEAFVRLCVHISVCVCVRERKCEVITKVYFMSCFGPPSVCFVYLGGHNSFGWLDCVSKMCSLPPARHINHCLPCWLTLHHTNPSPKTTLASVKKYPTKYFFTWTIRHFATPRIFTKSIYSVVFQ